MDNREPAISCGRRRRVPQGDGFVTINCSTRLKDLCPYCATIFRNDWKKIGRDGILNAPEGSVIFFVTLTAPGSFGQVHFVRKPAGPPQRCPCGKTHHPDRDADLRGVAINPHTYDYAAQVEWNYNIGKLWSNTARSIQHYMPGAEFFGGFEFQARGALHLHVLVRVPHNVATSEEKLINRIKDISARTVQGNRIKWGKDLHAKRMTGKEGLSSRVLQRNGVQRKMEYLLKAVGYTAKDVGIDPTRDADRSLDHFFRLDKAAHQMKCDRCALLGPGYVCQGRAHYRWGARQRLIVVSRPSPKKAKIGWSPSGITRAKQHAARVAYARIMAPLREASLYKPDNPPPASGDDWTTDNLLDKDKG